MLDMGRIHCVISEQWTGVRYTDTIAYGRQFFDMRIFYGSQGAGMSDDRYPGCREARFAFCGQNTTR